MSESDHPFGFEVRSVESMGPIQMITLAFPGNRFRGEILPELERLKAAEIVRIVDLLLVRKDPGGNIMVTTASDLTGTRRSRSARTSARSPGSRPTGPRGSSAAR